MANSTDRKKIKAYFEDIILKSVDIVFKPTYNYKETCLILDCHFSTFKRLLKKGLIHTSPHRRIYVEELIQYFDIENSC